MGRWRRGVALAIGLALAAALAPAIGAADEPPRDETAARIEERVAAGTLPELRWPDFSDYRAILVALYEPRGWAPLWLDAGRPIEPAADATRALLGADALGLSAADYDAVRLDGARQGLAAGAIATPDTQARFDVALSVGLLRHVSDLHIGRVNPRKLSFGFDLEPKKYDLAAVVARAVAEDRIPELVADAPPAFAQHRLLLEQLARYRALAADATVGPVAVTGKLAPRDPCPGCDALRQWLAALGDLPASAAPAPDAATPTPIYDVELVAGVQRFQTRHGLEPDGVIGKATAAALAVPAERRVVQIELALERLRWIPALPRSPQDSAGWGRAIFVNIPAFELFAFEELGRSGTPALAMRVVVGKAGTRTPVFTGGLDTVAFAPYWNVPRSIVVNEIVPKLRRNPGYLAAQDMEIVGGGIAELEAGKARLRQRPGPKNALGRVKFLFPNSHSVYLHDTPSRGLFARARRDFSHGCIRVEKPADLAAWLLRDRADWPPARQHEAMAGRKEIAVKVAPPVPVVLFYTTAVVRPVPDGNGGLRGQIEFYEDVYQYDAKLERALAAGYPYL
jgi:murein L,D-transpeptidase YcbB/YkuD